MLAALLVALASNGASAQGGASDLTPRLVVEHGLGRRLYPPAALDEIGSPLGLVIAGAEAHLGHGTSDNRTPRRVIALDLNAGSPHYGRAVTVLADGRRTAVPSAYSSPLRPFEMRTEGTIPVALAGLDGGAAGVAYLDHDPLTSRSEVYRFVTGLDGSPRPPHTRRLGVLAHNRDVAAVGRLVVAHNPASDGSLAVSTSGGYAWRRATGTPPRAYGKLFVFRGRIYASFFPAHTPHVVSINGSGRARPLWRREADFWPAGSSFTTRVAGAARVLWPQVQAGYETAEGLYLHTTGGLFFTPDPARVGPTRVGAPEGAVYAVHGGRLYAHTGATLRRLDGQAWEAVATLRVPFDVARFAISEEGDLVFAGGAGDDLALGFVPAASARPALR